jgi:hypothetical protein
MPPEAPAISLVVIEPPLSPTDHTVRDIHVLMRNNEWTAIDSRNAQLVFIEQFAKIKCGGTFNIKYPVGPSH